MDLNQMLKESKEKKKIIDENLAFFGAEKVYVLINKLAAEHFFGRIVISLQNGQIKSLKKEETFKPSQI